MEVRDARKSDLPAAFGCSGIVKSAAAKMQHWEKIDGLPLRGDDLDERTGRIKLEGMPSDQVGDRPGYMTRS